MRASLVRKRARVLGDVEALTRQEAEATAIKKFDLDDEQRSRLVVQERGQSPAPLRVSAFVATMSQFKHHCRPSLQSRRRLPTLSWIVQPRQQLRQA